MAARTHQRWLRFDGLGHAKYSLADVGLLKLVLKKPPWPLDTEDGLDRETYVFDLLTEFVGMMEVCRHEPFRPVARVPMLPLCEVALDDCVERGVAQPPIHQTSCALVERQLTLMSTTVFLSAYAHPVSKHAPEAIRGSRDLHSYDHYASELVLLYVVAFAIRELEAFRRMADREPAVEVRDWEDDVVPVLLSARERAAHLWFVGDNPPQFDREEVATYRNRRDRVPQPVTSEQVQAIPDDEVGYYENPLRRLKEMHRATRGYPWLLYQSPWPRADAFSF
jgi:hypothetical protein